MVIKNSRGLKKLTGGNKFIGEFPLMDNSSINFSGKNNVLVCEKNIKLLNSNIEFNGDNSIVYLCENKNDTKIKVNIYNNSCLYIGKNNYISGTINFILSEEKHIFIGDGGLYSFDLWIRVADPHLVYDCLSKERINFSKSVFIGDHVWIGQSALILKGSKIYSGSIIGAKSVVAGKSISSNTSWAGSPVKRISENIFWDAACVHTWTKDKTEKTKYFQSDKYIYNDDIDNFISFEEIDDNLTNAKTAMKKYEYLKKIKSNKNRFAKHIKPKRKFLFFK